MREGSVRGPTPYPFYSIFNRKGNSFVYLPLKNGTPCEITDAKGARGIKNKKKIVFISIQVKGLVFTTAKKIAQRRIVK